ncbi:MAG: phosphoribosylglycinamide formyltransferase [Bacteroidales bacterium]
MKRIAIFASGSGTNMQRIAEYFQDNPAVEVSVLVCNKSGAGVIQRAEKLQIPVLMINRSDFYQSDAITKQLIDLQIDLIVLAGFLWLIPDHLLQAFPHRIINIHPALLPKYGGKGMFGEHVHQAVIMANEAESGITIHYVNEHYDEGAVIFQASFRLVSGETPDSLAQRIHQLEYRHFPEVIERLLS